MRLEEVLPAYRAGKRIRRKEWRGDHPGMRIDGSAVRLENIELGEEDWEIVSPPPARVMGRDEMVGIVLAAHPSSDAVKRLDQSYTRLLAVAEAAEEVERALDRNEGATHRELREALKAAGFLGAESATVQRTEGFQGEGP